MKFLLDANIPYSAKELFTPPDEAAHVRDVGLADAPDGEILEFARKAKAVLITRDLDFANIILHPISAHYGVIVLRIPSHFRLKHIISLMRLFFSRVKGEVLMKRLTILEPGRFRIRGK